MPRGGFSYQNANIRAKLSQCLTVAQIRSLAACQTLEDALEKLKETRYEEVCSDCKNTHNLISLEMSLQAQEAQSFRGMRSGFSGAERKFVCSLISHYDTFALKVQLNHWLDEHILKRNITVSVNFIVEKSFIRWVPFSWMVHIFLKISHCRSFGDVVNALSDTPYRDVLIPYVDVCREYSSVFYFHAALDLFYYQHLKICINNLSAFDRFLASRFFGTEVDFENLIFQIRYRDSGVGIDSWENALGFFLPGGRKLKKSDIQIVLQNSQTLSSYLQDSYPMARIRIDHGVNDREKVEMYYNAEMKRLSEVMRVSNPLSIAPVVFYFYQIKWECKCVLGLIESAYYGLNQKNTEEALCLLPQQ